jgi:hypothetical protein
MTRRMPPYKKGVKRRVKKEEVKTKKKLGVFNLSPKKKTATD